MQSFSNKIVHALECITEIYKGKMGSFMSAAELITKKR